MSSGLVVSAILLALINHTVNKNCLLVIITKDNIHTQLVIKIQLIYIIFSLLYMFAYNLLS